MMIHGTADDQVNVSQSRCLNQSLSSLGYTVKYIEVPGATHDASFLVYGREMEIFNWFNDHPLWSAQTHALHLNAGWNMVSFPVIPANSSFSSILSGAGYYQVVTWSGTSYVDAENAEAGRGYWVLVLSATTLNITGTRVESYEFDLPAGWSMIGSIYERTANATLIFPSTYQLVTWSGTSYVSATTIEPGRGYWALVLESTHIIVDQSCNIQGINIVLLNATGPLLTSPSGAFRWLDVADQAYGSSYRNSYNYSQATVAVAYGMVGSALTGRLVARNLKPNFAYQLKLVGIPSSSDNALIGFAGRWWQEAWNGSAWTDGMNLNDKGNGSFPNPNDLTYFSRHLVADGSSPTGYHYRYTAYLLFDYFITDSKGAAIVLFETGSSCHVLWKTSQRLPAADDGPVKTVTFDPDPSQTAYDQDYPISTISIFGEWERLPPGGVNLNPSQYDCQIVLTEESFHGTGSFAGNWASTMTGEITFTIV
jgi:hypothetical protein